MKCLEFVEHYLQRSNASAAARQMGYTGRSAASQDWEFARYPDIRDQTER